MARAKALMRDYIGRVVTSVRDMTTVGKVHFPAGTSFLVTSTHRGTLSLEEVPRRRLLPAPADCGAAFAGIRKVAREDVTFGGPLSAPCVCRHALAAHGRETQTEPCRFRSGGCGCGVFRIALAVEEDCYP